jgi:hypothetical protein
MTAPFSFFAAVGYPFGGVPQKLSARIAPGCYFLTATPAMAPDIKILQMASDRSVRRTTGRQ